MAIHVKIAERALGRKLPRGSHVHHIDGNHENNDPTNLMICPSAAYHALIHRRTDAYNACGNANWVKCPYCKKYDDPNDPRTDMRVRVRPKTGTWQCAHRECEKQHFNSVWEKQHGLRGTPVNRRVKLKEKANLRRNPVRLMLITRQNPPRPRN